MRLLTCHGAGLNNVLMSKNTEKKQLVRALQSVNAMHVGSHKRRSCTLVVRTHDAIEICSYLYHCSEWHFKFRSTQMAEQKPSNRTRFCVGEKRGFGQVSSVYGQSEPDRNPDTYKMDRRKGRKRKHPLFRACHVDRRQNTSCGIHIDLEYKFVGAHDG